MTEHLKCSHCKETLPISSFNKICEGRRSKKEGARVYAYWCKQCAEASRKEKRRLYVPTSKEQGWSNHLRKRYGITVEDYEILHKTQSGVCAICGKQDGSRYGKLCVDHDHATGKIRKLLCSYCNKGLGNFKDDVDLLQKAIEYLTSLK